MPICPLCKKGVNMDISMEVHVNLCLDSQSTSSGTVSSNTFKSSHILQTIKNKNKSIPTTDPDKAKNKLKTCPFYKRIRDTNYVVDAFSYGSIPGCNGYFLSHFHSDHFTGLRSNWCHGPIYCSQITANLVRQELKVNDQYVHALPMNKLCSLPDSDIKVGLIDANHCPGSVLFLFVIPKGEGVVRHLHTGDFRASPRMCLHPLLSSHDIQCLYLDTTYMKPQYSFPAQEECIHAVCDIVKNEIDMKSTTFLDKWVHNPVMSSKHPLLIVVGTYTIGKERVFYNIAKTLQSKIYVTEHKKRILLCQENNELSQLLTSNPEEAQVHVLPLGDIRPDNMSKYLLDHQHKYRRLLAFKPTGWTYKSTKIETSDLKMSPLSQLVTPPMDRTIHLSPSYQSNTIKIYSVPYSEHSSFRELASFIASLNIKHIIPTVNVLQAHDMATYFNRWLQEKKTANINVPYPNEDHW